MMVKYYFFILSVITFSPLTSSNYFTYEQLISLDKKAVVITNYQEFPNCFITYVNIHGIPYIVKQKKRPKKGMSAVRDTLAAWIGQDLKIIHSAQLIAANQDFPGKKKGWPALLLTVAPGKTIGNQQQGKYAELNLKQRKDDDIYAHDKWLTHTMIHQITWHDQLPILLALDVFIGNTGRHSANLFYDTGQDIFCGIDMDHCYSVNLASIAIARFNCMILTKKIFTQKEMRALGIIKNTLEFLVEHYPAEKIMRKLDLLVRQGGMVYTVSGVIDQTEKIKKVIQATQVSSINLISLLDKMMRAFYRKGQNGTME